MKKYFFTPIFNYLTLKACFVLFAFAAISGCSNRPAYEKAVDPLEGGRGFIENLQQGDVKKAHFYIVADSENEAYFKELSERYLRLDKEGRMQMRQASLQINEVKAIDPHTTIIDYENSFEHIPQKLKVVETPEGWKVDLKFTYKAQ
jgi:hypothetical protein